MPSKISSLAFATVLALLLTRTGLNASETRKLVLGAGCFWCVEAVYEQQPGVLNVVSGYAGGPEKNPTYEQVSAGKTGHAEAVEIEYDPTLTSVRDLVELFWKTHDPTDPTGVWPDFGKQYRSILFYDGDAERGIIQSSAARAQEKLKKAIATQIVPLGKFYKAEEYHQDFVKRNPNHPYVQRIAVPKLNKLHLKTP